MGYFDKVGRLYDDASVCTPSGNPVRQPYHRISIRGEAWCDFVFDNHLQPGDELRFTVTNEPNEEAIFVFTVNCFRD
ncbi:hypothetical protein L484_018132 [Morus notabilis]|uniref:TF-B3 domain-containing protein n=1 Tax=Morus notabilis TaxID=981085 RepID=W9QVC3_9ROSA|nr:hypothetical protein L484_018132 [Morus notabilis]